MSTNTPKVSPARPDFNPFYGTGGLLMGTPTGKEVCMDHRRKRRWRIWDWVMGFRLILLILDQLL